MNRDLLIAYYYLVEGWSYEKLEGKFLVVNQHGTKARRILQSLGIMSSKKGILKTVKIEDEIASASGAYKNVLNEISKMNYSPITAKVLIPSDELKIMLIGELNDVIIPLVNKTTQIDSDLEPVEIVFSDRKKATSKWYETLHRFLKKNLAEYSKKLDLLESEVLRVKLANDINTYDNKIKPIIKMLLNLIIGLNYPGDEDVVSEALKYREELERAIVVYIVLGEYEDHFLDQYKKRINEKEDLNPNICIHSKIRLYLSNIEDVANRDGYNVYDKLYTVLAHEYLHYHQYFCLFSNGRHVPSSIINAINTYRPGAIVKESLASYFEYIYGICKRYYNISNDLKLSWTKHSVDYWPYSGAGYIVNDYHFMAIFYESLFSFHGALTLLFKSKP